MVAAGLWLSGVHARAGLVAGEGGPGEGIAHEHKAQRGEDIRDREHEEGEVVVAGNVERDQKL